MKHQIPLRFADFEPALHAAARGETGFSDFGDPDYLLGLRRLIEAYAIDLPDDLATRQACFEMTLPGLIGRLYSERGWAEYPECLEASIVRPLIITGIPRTGTTALHMLLAMDPQFQGLEHWILTNPIVRPARALWDAHPVYRRAVQRVEALVESSPKIADVHGIAAHDVDECLPLMMQSFITNQIPSLLHLPTYDEWFFTQDETASYRRLADNLRLIGFAEPEKTWLLKNPTDLMRMETLLAVFPDARVIHTHRDPVPTFGSLCSMLSAYRGNPAPGSPEACVIGPRQLRFYKIGIEHTMAVRERHPGAFHDVYQPALRADPMRVVHGIYERFELELTREAEQRMQRWVAEHSEGAGRQHHYDCEGFGLSAAEIRQAFGGYMARYDL
ncbi:MAG: sulfotransferase [Deltaproteobacteria bacterium]|nr:sulfotransferase [Deltaproteobacteria bacterium]